MKLPPELVAMLDKAPVTLPRRINTFPMEAFQTHEGTMELAQVFLDGARETFLEGPGSHAAMSFVFCSQDPGGTGNHVIYGMQIKHNADYSPYAKDCLAGLTQTVCTHGQAVGVLMIMEAWMNTGTPPDEMKAWQDAHDGSLEGHPNTKERLIVTLELHAGQHMWLAEIKRGKHHTLGPWEKVPNAMGFRGRFHGFLFDPKKLN